MSGKKSKSITLDNTVIDAIKKMSKESGRTFSNFTNEVLKQYILTKEKAVTKEKPSRDITIFEI